MATVDQRLRLIHQGEGHYRATLPAALENRWYLEVRGPDNDWRLTGEASLPAQGCAQIFL
ncbi:FixH family protein [Tamilnaduibacter salinus]|uniref:FixH family protein n=1 Tax=Tamilnaduibacter salinus TaxID=1484056 RepID=UPI001304748B